MAAPTERVLVGTAGKPHGLRGEFTVLVRTDEPDLRFAPGAALELGQGGKPVTVTASRWHSGVLLLSLAGVADRTAAEGLRGSDMWARVPADAMPEDDDEFYDRQLIGLEARDASGAPVGRVVTVTHGPGQDLLVIDVAGEERLVPFVSALVPVVDVAGGFVQIADLPGLLADEDA